MRIADLEDNLRAHIWARTHRGELTGSGLSRDAGFQQAHMSNFLNARRGLSPEAMDRLLDVLQVDVLDLADPEELRLRALQRPERASSFDSVPLVSLQDAAFEPRIPPRHARDMLKFRKRFLQRLRPDTIGDRADWLRFVLIKADVVNGHHVGMVQRRGEARFLLEAAAEVGIVRHGFGKQFQSDLAPYAGVESLVDFAHPAGA